MVFAIVVLACLLAAAAVCTVRPSLLAVMVVAVVSLAWVLVNGPVEGAILISFSHTHGLTLADLATVVAIPALWSYLRGARLSDSATPGQ